MKFSLSHSMVAFFSYQKILLLFLGLYTLLFLGCSNKISVSPYAKYNRIDHNWFQTFINDSLQFSIDFYGRNEFIQFENARKHVISKSDIAILKSLGIRKKAKVLLYLKPIIKKYGQASYGYLVDTGLLKTDTSRAIFDKTKKGDEFFTFKKIFKKKNETSVVGGTQINNKYLLLVESQKEPAFEYWNNEWQTGNTIGQLSSLLKGENTVSYLFRRKKLTNAIDSSLYMTNYIIAVNALRAIPKDTIEEYNLDNYYYQDLVTRISYFDNLDSIHESYEQYRSASTTASPNNKFIVDGDAIEKVSKIAKNQKMLMINEMHYDYRHRLFVYLLLDSLYKSGYRNLCLETLKQGSKYNFINKDVGFYIAEPFYATLFRKAKEIGFNVYAYDTFAPATQEREFGQAKNLFDLYSKDSKHKWIVLAGYSHINKRYFTRESPSALQFFTKLAGFAPYSINQSDLSDITDQRYSVPYTSVGYYAIDTSSYIYKNKQSDLYIINNIKKHPFESPFASIQPYLQKYIIDIPQRITHADNNLLVYIKKEHDALHNLAIPVYISKAKKDKQLVLYLPSCEYIGIIIDNEGSEAGKFELMTAKRRLP